MKRYGEAFDLTQDLMNTIAGYMDDDIRENLHVELAPCTHEVFLEAYVKADPEFESLLNDEFGIELEA